MTPNRFKVLRYYLSTRNNVSLTEMSGYFFSPSYKSIANRFIEKKELEQSYYKVSLKGVQDPMYYPAGHNMHSLYQVIVESFDPKNWHYYEIAQTRVEPHDIVVDCGAAEGLFALIVHRRCKKVYLIEPLAKFVESLKKTFEKADNVEIIPVAISDASFKTNIISNDISSSLSANAEGQEVEVTTLDKLFHDKGLAVSYLKMDLEGYDYKALLGAEHLIRRNRPKIAVTTYHEKTHADQIGAYLKSIVQEYHILTKGISQETGSPIMLHAWI